MRKTHVVFVVAAASCGVSDDSSLAVGSNALGVTAVRYEHSAVDGNSVFALHALAGEVEVASLRRTTGEIAGISRSLPGTDDIGTEVVMSSGGTEQPIVSRETTWVHLDVDSAFATVLAQPQVAALLEREGQLVVATHPVSDGERAYTTSQCRNDYLLTSPLARQCCYTDMGSYVGDQYTMFVRPEGSVAKRLHNPYGIGCRAYDGLSPCNGAECYYGPGAFGRATISGPSSYAKIYSVWTGTATACTFAFYSTQQSPEFWDIPGTQTNQGCPAPNGSSEGDWSY